MSETFTQSEVAAHKTPQDLWIIVDEDVYDLTKFQSEHPGKAWSRSPIMEDIVANTA
jgi:cytochrome b involved in lipid metabolism